MPHNALLSSCVFVSPLHASGEAIHTFLGFCFEALIFMKRLCTMLTWILLGTFAVGCGGGGVEVGSSTETPPSGGPSHFQEAMKNTGNKMMKKQMPKDSGGKTK